MTETKALTRDEERRRQYLNRVARSRAYWLLTDDEWKERGMLNSQRHKARVTEMFIRAERARRLWKVRREYIRRFAWLFIAELF